jgi:hypothetical protein
MAQFSTLTSRLAAQLQAIDEESTRFLLAGTGVDV